MPKFSFGGIFAKLSRKSSPDTATHEAFIDVRLNIPPLPQEILLHIASFAKGDDATLHALVRTSRDWHSASIPYIFHSVVVDSKQRLDLFNEILRFEPQVALSVRLLSIHCVFEPLKLDIRAALTTVRGLPNLTTLVMRNRYGVMYDDMSSDILDLISTLSTITHLDLVGSFHPSVAVAMAASLPNLSHFAMVEMSFPRQSKGYSEYTHRLETLRLTTLRLDWFPLLSTPLQGTLIRISASACKESLKSVSLPVCQDDLQSVGHFLRELSLTLEHLELKLIKMMPSEDRFSRYPRWDMTAFRRELDLSQMIALHSFTFHYYVRRNPQDLENLVSIFSMLPYQQIRKLTIHLYLDFPSNVSEYLSPLVTQISNERFKSLEEVEYIYSGPLPISQVSAIIEESLSSLHAKGILKVHCACAGVCVWATDGYHRKKYL